MSIKSGTHLDTVKRQLLQDPDWATVSAARPLEITFTPAEEIEQFGKRRKLNDHDRKRLSAAHGHRSLSGLATLCRNDRDASSKEAGLDQIKIRIDGRPAGLHSSGQGKSTNLSSSQSMLLDHETSLVPDPSARNSERCRPGYERVAKSSQPTLRKFLASICRTPASEVTEPLDDVVSGTPRMEKLSTRSPRPSERNSNRIGSQHLFAADQLLQAQHFTIDDQVLTERTRQATALNYRALSCSPATTLVASPAPSNAHVLPHREILSWLPCPRHFNDLSSPNSGRLHATSLPECIANQSPYLDPPAHIFRDVPLLNSPPEPVRLFGQLIDTRNDETVENL